MIAQPRLPAQRREVHTALSSGKTSSTADPLQIKVAAGHLSSLVYYRANTIDDCQARQFERRSENNRMKVHDDASPALCTRVLHPRGRPALVFHGCCN